MTESAEKLVDALRASMTEVARLRKHNQQLIAATSEPIAIVGMACRFPGGADSPEALWQLVEGGVDAITACPNDRGWDFGQPSSGAEPQGGFVQGMMDFDAEFFHISPREATAMDPQQRVLLETTWEAIERAGIDPTTLRGSRTGVYVGAVQPSYFADPQSPDLRAYAVTASVASVVSGRLAYVLGLEGAAVTVDTACSSSLAAIHMACQALRQGECTLALGGGVTFMANMATFHGFADQGALAGNSRCKAFAAAADGMTLAEGAGVLLLERLSNAQQNGHQVLAVIRGSAMNSDGASNGLTAPNGLSQQRVIKDALENAHLSAADIDAVEAHGTGTTLGDPIEATALIASYGQDRAAGRPLWLGSIKSNIGHTQAAAGVAGIIKMVQAMRFGVLPKTLHVDAPSPHVDWSAGAVKLLTEPRDWPADRPRRAAVSSFGISGTNVHTILEQGPPPSRSDQLNEEDCLPLLLSAKSSDSLRGQARRLQQFLAANPDENLASVAQAMATTRSWFDHRLAIVANDQDQVVGELEAFASGGKAATVLHGRVEMRGRMAFAFPGDGPRWGSFDTSCVAARPFNAKLMECYAALGQFVDWSPEAKTHDQLGALSRDRSDVRLILTFATQVAWAELARNLGLRPFSLIGEGIGEVSAACVSGALSLEDAVCVAAAYARAAVTRDRVTRDALFAVMSDVSLQEGQLPCYSAATGTLVDPLGWRHLFARIPGASRLAETARGVASSGHAFVVGIGASDEFVAELRLTLTNCTDVLAVAWPRSGQTTLAAVIGQAFVNGLPLDLSSVFTGRTSVTGELPTYAFERRRYWRPLSDASVDTRAVGPAARSAESPRQPLFEAAGDISAVLTTVRNAVAEIMEYPSEDAVDVRRTFQELGFDSITALDFRALMEKMTKLALPESLIFDYPTPLELGRYLHDQLNGITAPIVVEQRPLVTDRSDDEDPIVLVGLSCRAPGGANSADDLWDIVVGERDVVTRMPGDRGWELDTLIASENATGVVQTLRQAGFLDRAGEFDAEFFGISPEEALVLDPQHRILLEMSWEAFEHAGIDPLSLRGEDIGVYVGMSYQPYVTDIAEVPVASLPYVGSGASPALAVGRVSHLLGLTGPTVALDAACSSSAVALHLACRAVRSGECSMALAGGVTVLAFPVTMPDLVGSAASDGRCRSFSAKADGTGYGEGAGVVVVERLSDARRRGHHVLAVVKGSATNHNGGSNGLTAPNGASQQRLIRAALADARVSPDDVDAVEVHGAATQLGDSIEARALLATYGCERPANDPLWLGTVKSNIGHAHAASGVLGVIKTVMALRNAVLPATLYAEPPSTKIDWSSGTMALLSESRAWPEADHPRRAAVSSFGSNGSKAHFILEEAPSSVDLVDPVVSGVIPWVLSGRTANAVRAQALKLAEHLRRDRMSRAADVGLSLAGRSRFEHRAVLLGTDRDELCVGLDRLAREESAADITVGAVNSGVTLSFGGLNGSVPQVGELCAAFSAFAEGWEEATAQLNRAFSDDSGFKSAVSDENPAGAAAFAAEVGLFALLRSLGVRPTTVSGQGLGQVVALYAAGTLTLDQAASLAVAKMRGFDALSSLVPRLSFRPPNIPVQSPVAGVATDIVDWRKPSHWSYDGGEGSVASTPMTVGFVNGQQWTTRAVLNIAARAYVCGAEVDWSSVLTSLGGRKVHLPTYAFQRANYWLGSSEVFHAKA